MLKWPGSEPSYSLARRLHLGLALSLLLLMLVAGWSLHLALAQFGQQFTGSRLDHDAEALLAALQFSPEGTARLDPNRLGPVYQYPLSGHYYSLRLADGSLLRSRSLWDGALEFADLPPGQRALRQIVGPGGQTLLLWSGGFRKQGRDLTIAVAEDLGPLHASLAEFRRHYALGGLAALLLLLLVQHAVVRRSLRGLERVRDDVRRLERGEVQRLGEHAPREVLPLVREVNRLLQQLGQRLQRSRNALGNLAHALKTPLTLLGQLAQHPHLARQPELARELAQQVELLRRRVERELKRARLAGKAPPGARFVPEQELPGLFNVLQRLHRDKVLDLRQRVAPGLWLAADREDMLELLGNLLDNACQWARREVVCEFSAYPGGVCLRVRDDGPGVEPAALARLAQRGTRLDETRPGHGLGLAIVSEVVRLYGGSLEFGLSPGGGLEVEVRLPTG